MLDWLFLAYIGIGLLAGLAAGLLGIGGGAVFGPLLLIVFGWQGMPADEAAIAAVSTSIAAVLLTSLTSASVHSMQRSVSWRSVAVLGPAAAIGAALGAQLAKVIPSFLLVLGMLMLLSWSIHNLMSNSNKAAHDTVRIGRKALGVVGAGAGCIGAMTGTGGGVIAVPWLVRAGLDLKLAIGTSATMTFLVATGSTLSYAGIGVNTNAILGVAASCILAAIAGARLNKVLPVAVIRNIYCVFMIAVCARLAYWLVELGLAA